MRKLAIAFAVTLAPTVSNAQSTPKVEFALTVLGNDKVVLMEKSSGCVWVGDVPANPNQRIVWQFSGPVGSAQFCAALIDYRPRAAGN